VNAEIVSIGVAAPSAAYGKRLTPATAFVDDALAHVRAIAKTVDATLTERKDRAATCEQVTADVRAAAARLQAAEAGLFVLSYAGHGGQCADASGDEDDGRDEGWALDDHPMIDDTLADLLGAIHRDVHVVVLSNCCFSGGMFDAAAWRGPPHLAASSGSMARNDGPLRLFGRQIDVDRVRRRIGQLVDRLEVSLDRLVGLADRSLQRAADALGDTRDRGLPSGPEQARPRSMTPPPVLTNRVIIASCSDQQGTLMTSESRLTAKVLETVFPVDEGRRVRRPVEYATLEVELARMASSTQTPVVLTSPLDKARQAFVPQPLVWA
jgi:Caspase domain